jgi:hypothetical protein
MAFNGRLHDLCSYAPKRFAPMAMIRCNGVEAAITEIRWAKDAGFADVLLSVFDINAPLME